MRSHLHDESWGSSGTPSVRLAASFQPVRPESSRLLTSEQARRLLRVPQVTVFFWVIKALSTAMGEATSDYLVHAMAPVLAVLGFVGFLGAAAIVPKMPTMTTAVQYATAT